MVAGGSRFQIPKVTDPGLHIQRLGLVSDSFFVSLASPSTHEEDVTVLSPPNSFMLLRFGGATGLHPLQFDCLPLLKKRLNNHHSVVSGGISFQIPKPEDLEVTEPGLHI